MDREINGQLDMNAISYIRSANPSLAFVGTAAWDAQKGVTSSTVAKQTMKKTIKEQSGKAVLLADSSKYGLCNP